MHKSLLLRLTTFSPVGGHSYLCILPEDLPPGDSLEHPLRSAIEVFEDGRALGPAHTLHQEIQIDGGGGFSHWQNALYLSTSDNSDPWRNGKAYEAYVPARPPSERQQRLRHLIGGLRDDMAEIEAYDLAEALFYEACPSGFIGDVTKTCWQDQHFVQDYQRLVPFNRRSFERKYVVSQLVMGLRNVAGDMAECGVYNGATAYFMARASVQAGTSRRLHLFDSFEGLSQPGPIDGNFWTRGGLAMPERVARGNLEGCDGIHFYRGWIPDRFAEVADRRFAFVHIDVDLYQPTLDSVAFFYQRLVPGGIIVCDDYGFTTCPGATRAMDEFMADKPEHIVHLPTGQGVIFRGR